MPWTSTGVVSSIRMLMTYYSRSSRKPALACRHGLLSRFGQSFGGDELEPALRKNFPALLDIGAGEPDHQRHLDVDGFARLHHALGNPVTAIDAGEDVDQHGPHLGVGQNKLQRSGDALR